MRTEVAFVIPVRCLLANSSSARLAAALATLQGWGPCVVIAPGRSVADELVWRLAEAGHPTSGVQRTTPGLLAGELASQALAREGRATVGETAARAVLAQAVEVAGEERQLEWFAEVAELPGFVPSLQRTLKELRFAGLSSALLGRVANCSGTSQYESETRKGAHLRLLEGGEAAEAETLSGAHSATVLQELAHLAGRYERELQHWGLADGAWVTARAIEVLSSGRSQSEQADQPGGSLADRLLAPWRDLPQLWLDVPLHSVIDREFFAAACAMASEVVVVAPARDRQTLAAVSQVSAAAGCKEPQVEALGQHQDGVSRLRRVQESVFASTVSDPDVPADDDDSFEFFSAAGEGQEAVEIARRIGKLAERGVPFDEIAILVRQPSVHVPLIEDALSRAGIPGYFARGTARPDPSGRAFLSLLACAEDGLSATRFAEYLSFDQLPELTDSGSSGSPEHGSAKPSKTAIRSEAASEAVPWVAPESPQLVFSSLIDGEKFVEDEEQEKVKNAVFQRPESGLRDGLSEAEEETWVRRPAPAAWERLIVDASVVGGVERWRRRLRGLAAEIDRHARAFEVDDEVRALALRARGRRLQDLQDVALPLIELLEALPEGLTWADWLQALEQLAVKALRWPRSVLAVLAELRPMASVKNVTLRQVQKILEEPLRSMEAEPPKRRQGRVFVGPIEQVRGRSFRVVFVPGLAEGVFPARATEDPLLLDLERLRLSSDVLGGIPEGEEGSVSELATQSTRFHRERLLLRLAVGAASERLVVSYSRIDVMLGRARVPSFYALDLLRAAEGSIPTLAQLEQRAAALGGVAGAGASWPAPERPEDAIDDAEFDLALLHPREQEAGAARFLLFANPHLKRSLNARARRWRRPFTWADGLVVEQGKDGVGSDSAVTRALLEEHRPSRRSFSPTALQHFSACPYRFLLQALHRLRPREDRTGFEQLDPLTRGSLFHDTQFYLFARLRDRGLLPVNSANLAEVLDHADAVLDETAAKTYEEMAPAIDRIWTVEVESLRNDLRGWLRQVSETPSWRPVAAELAFGLPNTDDRDSCSVEDPVEVSGFLLRGSIDLVEFSETLSRLRVTDHKTGRAYGKPSMVIEGGQVLQPVLYALVMEQLVKDGLDIGGLRSQADSQDRDNGGCDSGPSPAPSLHTEPPVSELDDVAVESGRLYFCTTRGGYSEVDVPLARGARTSADQLFETVDAHIREGFLPAAPNKGACRYCDYSLVCGPYEERRILRKQKDRLVTLERLRGLR